MPESAVVISKSATARLCFVVTAPYAIHAFLKKPILQLIDEGYSVTVCTNIKQIGGNADFPGNIRVVDIPLERNISPLRDMFALIRLLLLFRREKFDVVHSLLPKSGLLSMVAARCTGIRHRVHTFTGQVWATSTGMRRGLLKMADRIIATCSSRVLADSFSQLDFLVAEKVVSKKKIGVLANGSICGVDLERFAHDPLARARVRRQHCIGLSAVVILFAGRMTREKGVFELLQAFHQLREDWASRQDVHLLLVGPDDGDVVKELPIGQGITYIGFTSEIQGYFSAADIFCLPSYREGFGSVLIEAASAGLPVVATRIYGIIDAVVDGNTAMLVEPREVVQLLKVLEVLIGDQNLRKAMGEKGKARVQELFSTEIVCASWSEFYRRLFV